MSCMNVAARHRMVCVVGVWVFIALFGAGPALAASASRNQQEQGQELPLLTTLPADGAVTVRPDSVVSFQLDTNSPEYRAFRQQLESGRFAVQVEGGSSAQLYVGEQRSGKTHVQPAGEATFDAETGTVSTPALSLGRYTTYTVTLAVKAAYEALLRGQPLPGNDSLTIAFITGSALNEPTHYQLAVSDAAPRVTDKARLTVLATDDYGNPAWGSSVSVRLAEDGSRRAFSAVANPSQALLSAPEGRVSFELTNTEAEGVQVSLQATGLYPENAWSGSASLRFRPGLPERMHYRSAPVAVTSETFFQVCASVYDRYLNPVEDGTVVFLSAWSSTGRASTKGGDFCGSLMAPYGQGTLSIRMTSGAAYLGVATKLVAPPATSFVLVAYPSPVPADGSRSVNVLAILKDAKGRPVLDGLEVYWSTSLGILSSLMTQTRNGMANVYLRSYTPGIAQVRGSAGRYGGLVRTVSVTFTPPGPTSITHVSYSQPCWSGAGDFDYGYGTFFRAKQGCDVQVSGIARDSNGSPVPNAPISVVVRLLWNYHSLRVYTDGSGRFTATLPVGTGLGRLVSPVTENGTVSYHHWDWAYVDFFSNSGPIGMSHRFQALLDVKASP